MIYLGSWVDSTDEDVRNRKCLAWAGASKMKKIFNVHCKGYVTKEELYETMMRVTDKIQERRMWFAGHNIRQAGTPLSKLILWEPTHGRSSRGRRASRGRSALIYVEVLKSDVGVTDTEEITTCMKEGAE